MSFQDNLGPVDPVVFRDLCLKLFDHAHEWSKERGQPFDIFVGGAIFIMDYFDIKNGGEEARVQYVRSMMRLTDLVKLLTSKEVDLGELCRSPDEDSREVHYAILEAAAVAPLREGEFDVEDLLAEARPRVKQIDALEKLLRVD